MTPLKVLVVENKKQIRLTLNKEPDNLGFAVIEATNVNESVKLFDLHRPAVTLVDTFLSDGSGFEVLREIKQLQSDAIVIMLTDEIRVDETLLALRSGAADYITKPVNFEELSQTIEDSIQRFDWRPKVRQPSDVSVGSFSFEHIIGESPAIQETISLARKISASNVSTVLLQGESGTGKDLIAKAIHYSSKRASKPFVAINCAAIPANLLESELFGYEKGAFTDAKTLKEGLFEQADGGTLFLDEIGELDLGLQAKLLRVLEEGAFRRVGGLRDLPLNVRVIAASNRNLKTESKENNFRQDLYYRLSIIQIELPPLRLRGDDVILLAEYFIKKLDKQWHHSPARKLAPEVAEAFRRYRWEGNVRELRNVIERALILEENELITMKYLPEEFQSNGNSRYLKKDFSEASFYFTLPPEGISLDMVEEWLIQEALDRSGGNVTRASAILRVSRDRIRYRLRKNKH
jgi:DNA-binding NtrC family response regulator